MALSPLCLVQDGTGPWVVTTNGVDVTPGNTISIKLASIADVTDWYLQVLGTDELITDPVLTGVNPLDNKVTTPTTTVTFTMPAGTGHAIRFESRVLGTGGPLTTTFGIYSLTDLGTRVGASGEELEGNGVYGWITITNPIIRSGASAVYYNDAAILPPTGANTVQGAIDFLKTSGGGGSFPDPETARQGQIGVVQEAMPGIRTPYGAVSDGTYLYVSEFSEYGIEGFNGTSIVYKLKPSGDGSVLEPILKVDLAAGAGLGAFDRVRDLGQDSTYLYATCTNGENIAIINKAAMTVVGWGWMGTGATPISVCADGAGNFYASDSATNIIGKFSTAACLGQPPGTVTYGSSYAAASEPTYVRFANGYLWASGNALKLLKINPVGMTLAGSFLPSTGLGESLYAFGSIWVPAQGVTDGLYRVDPATMTQQALVTFGASVANCITLGPDSLGTPDARLFVSDENWNFVFVVDPGTDTLEQIYTLLGRSFAHVANIGDVVYAMSSFYNGPYADRPGIYYVNHISGASGLIAYKQTIEYSAPPKNRVTLGDVGPLAYYTNSYLGQVGYSPKVADLTTQCEHSQYDSYWNVDGISQQGPYIWFARGQSGDILVFDLYSWATSYIIPLRQGQGSYSWPHTILLTRKYAWVLDNYPVIAKIDRVTRDVIEYNIKLPSLSYSQGGAGLAWDEANNRIFTTAYTAGDPGTIWAIDETTNAVTRYNFPAITEAGRGCILVGTDLFFFGLTQVWKIDTTTWAVVGSPITISAGTAIKRVIYAGGYIFALARAGTTLFRIDPATMAFTSLYIGTSIQDLAFCNDIPNKIGVAVLATGIQVVTNPFGTMTLGALWTSSGTGSNRTVTYDPENGYFFWSHGLTGSPRNDYLRYRYHTSSTGTVSSYTQFLNGVLEWASVAFTAAGDLTGSASSQTVVGLRGRTISTTAPTTGQVYAWNGSQWAPTSPGGMPTATLAEDLATWNGTAWAAKQPPAGIVNVVAGEGLYNGYGVVFERDRTAATTNYYAYKNNHAHDMMAGFTCDDSGYTTVGALWRSGTMLDGVYLYDACALTNTVVVVAWYESNAINLRAVTTPYNTGTGYFGVTAGSATTQITVSGACTDVCVVALSTTQFVVGWIYSGTGYLCACTYVSPSVGFTYGTPVAIQDAYMVTITDMISLALERLSWASENPSPMNIAVAFGRSTNLGYLQMAYIYSGSNTMYTNYTSTTFRTPFGSASCPPKCLTVRYLGHPSIYSGAEDRIGILYGDKARAVDVFRLTLGSNAERMFGYSFYPASGVWMLGGSGNVWRIDEDYASGGSFYYMDGATAEPGLGDFVGNDKWVHFFRGTNTGYTTRMVLTPGTVPYPGYAPNPGRPRLLPYNTSTQWGVKSVTITGMDSEAFIWGGRLTTNPSAVDSDWMNKDPIGVGVGYYRKGEVCVDVGAGPLYPLISGKYFTPTTANQYQRIKIVKLGINRFMLVFSGQQSPSTPSGVSIAIHLYLDQRPYIFGYTQEAASLGQTKRVAVLGGIHRATSGLTPGRTYFMGNGGGLEPNPRQEIEAGLAIDAASVLLTLGRTKGRNIY